MFLFPWRSMAVITHTHSHTRIHTLSLSYTDTQSLSYTHTLSLSHTRTYTYTHTPTPTHTYPHSRIFRYSEFYLISQLVSGYCYQTLRSHLIKITKENYWLMLSLLVWPSSVLMYYHICPKISSYFTLLLFYFSQKKFPDFFVLKGFSLEAQISRQC